MKRLFTFLLLVFCSYGLFAQIDVIIGTGTVNNSNTGYPAPYGNYFNAARHQLLIPASEIIAAGGFAGNITSLSFSVLTANAVALSGFQISLGTTTATALGTWQTPTMTQVFTSTSYTDIAGWNTHAFTTPFYWDGVSSLIIETCFNNIGISSYTYNAVMNQSTTAYISSMYFNTDTDPTVCAYLGTSTATQRPNMKLTFAPNGALDAGINSINSPVPPAAPGLQAVTATLQNYGTNTLTSATVNWSVNGVLQTPYPWTGSLASTTTTAPLPLGSFTFPMGSNTIKVWTSAPNNGVDSFPLNDTAKVTMSFITALMGTYTIGGTGANYASFGAALSDLMAAGVAGPVTFNVNSGTYTEQLTFPAILGATDVNTITFQSTADNADSVILQFTGTSAANFTVKLNGADFLRFKKLTIKNLDPTYGRVVDLTGGATYNLFEANKIISGGASSSTTGCIYDGSTLNHYNTYLNNYMQGGYYTMYIYGVSTSSWEKGTIVKGNEIVGSYYYPLYMYYCDSVEVIDNYIHDGVSPYSNGIMVYYVNNYYRITGNRVYIVGTSSTACYGIRDYYGNYASYNANPTGYGLVANNMISIQGGTGTNYGLYSYYGNGTETSYNTVLITAGSATASRALYQANTSTNTLGQSYYNNIWVNTGGGYAAYFSTVAQVTACDYNVYKSNTGTYFVYWGGARADLLALQTASSKDMNSISVMPAFVSNSDLHNSSLATYQLGTPLMSVTTDIDGQPRHGATPCMGADEYILYANDAGIIQMTSPVASCPGITDVKVKVKNFGIQSFTGVTVNWSVNGVAQSPYAFSGTLAMGTDQEVTLGTYNFLAGISYNLKFYSVNPGSAADQNPANDTLAVSGVKTAMSGTYTIGVGTGYDYNTIGAAVNDLKNNGVCGPIVFNIAAGTYTENMNLMNILGTSATNTVTFKSANNDNTSVTVQYASGSADNFVVNLYNASYIKFQHITFKAIGVSYGYVFNYGGASHYTEITNCRILTAVNTSSSFAGIYNSASNINGTVISNNVFDGGYYSIYWYGISSTSRGQGIVIQNNTFTNFYYYGVNVAYTDSVDVINNYLKNATGSTSLYGLRIYYCDYIDITANNIQLAGNATHYGMYLYYNTGNAVTPNVIANNVVNLTGTGTSTWYGIYFYTQNYSNAYHNTIQVSGGATSGYALYQSGGTNQNVVNNIFTHYGGGYAYYVATVAGILTSDNNNYFTSGATLAYWGIACTNLLALQTANLKDLASTQFNPVFANAAAGNVSPLSISIDNMGTPMGILTDINGITRSLTTPDIGAIEFTGIAADIAIAPGGYLAPGQCLSTNDSLYMKITNTIGSTINFATSTTTIYWNVAGPVNSNGTIVLNSGTLDPGVTMIVGKTGANLSQPGLYTLSGYVGANPVNLFQGNDTLNNIATKTIYDPFYVQPAHVFIGNPIDTAEISAKSTFFPGGAFYFSELCNYKTTAGAPTAGWPTYLLADDYVEITGVPNSDLAGYVLEMWNATALVWAYTFPAGTIMGPNGTAIIAIGQPGSSVPVPASYYYHAITTSTFGSSDVAGRLLKDGSGTIVDAAGYGNFTFPAISNVTTADWSAPLTSSGSSTSGFRLIGPDNNTGSNWVLTSATYPQDPNTVNTGVTVPTPTSLTGFTWSYNGVVTTTNVIDTVVGPWATSGMYNYVANYVTPCGTLVDTVHVHVLLASVTGDTLICSNDTAMVSVALPGTGPWSVIVTDGTGNDTIVVTSSPWVSYFTPTTTTTYTLLKLADMYNVYVNANLSHTVTVIPAPTVTLGAFSPVCASDPAFALSGGLPAGGTYGGAGVTAGMFNPATAGSGTHMVTYTYTDPTTLCASTAAEQIVVGAGPMVTVTADHDICPGTPTTLEVILAGSATPTMIFSEYIEGTSNNKAIEIFNATPDTLNLDNYRIGQSTNGGGWAFWHYFPTGAKLAPHTTWVMVANQVSSTYYDTTLANQVLAYPSVVHHNGDDARSVEVTTDGGVTWTIIDIIGDPMVDPGTGWPVAGVNNATADKTLIRKPNIVMGNTNWPMVAGTDSLTSEYIVNPVNYFANLGSHTFVAPPVQNLTYAWSTSATTQTITVTPSVTTTYTVTITDVASSCTVVKTIVVTVKPAAIVNLGPNFDVCDDGTRVIDAGAGFTSYLWSTGATTQTITADGAIIGLGNTVTYTVTVTNSAGCDGIDAVAVTAIDCSGIDDPDGSNSLTFWPNPSDGDFFVRIKGVKGDAVISVTNAAGQMITSENITLTGEMIREFHMSNIAPGIYMVRLQTKSDVITKQIIVK